MEAIAAAGIVAVLWARDGRFERVVEVLVEAGVTCVDFTLTSRGAVEALPGAFTPTEILRAWRAGADAVRFVPGLGRRAGVPAGGQGAAATSAAGPDRWVEPEEIGRHLDAGALAVGLGSPLVGDARAGGDLGALQRPAEAAAAEVREARAP